MRSRHGLQRASTGCPRCRTRRAPSASTLRGVDVDADDVVARLGERDGERQPDVAEPDDADLHPRESTCGAGGRAATIPAMRKALDHRHHRAGRLLPGRAAARQGLRGARPRSAARRCFNTEPDRPPLPRPARAGRAAVPALRRPHRRALAWSRCCDEIEPDEVYNLGAQSPRARLLRQARVHRRRHRRWAPCGCSRRSASRGVEPPLLPGVALGDVRRRRRRRRTRRRRSTRARPYARRQGLRLLGRP